MRRSAKVDVQSDIVVRLQDYSQDKIWGEEQ